MIPPRNPPQQHLLKSKCSAGTNTPTLCDNRSRNCPRPHRQPAGAAETTAPPHQPNQSQRPRSCLFLRLLHVRNELGHGRALHRVQRGSQVLVFIPIAGIISVAYLRRKRTGQTSTDRFPTNIGPLSDCFHEFLSRLCIRHDTVHPT